MDVIQNLLWIVLLAGGIALVVVLIMVLLRLKSSIELLLQEVQRFGDRTEPILEKLEKVAVKTEEALEMITENREALSEATGYIRKVAANIYRIENALQEQIEPSVMALARRLSGVRRGIETFLDVLRRRA
ncbi:MAG: hypothetical protein M5R41_05345 [Bacteroidia bacterium]|nr:hypothetical protein [Bacteroidia bacterium]